MLLDFIAAIPYAVQGDVRHAVYWVAAGVLTLTVHGDLWRKITLGSPYKGTKQV
jgi:hypothetical protein